MLEEKADLGRTMQLWQEINRKRLSVAQNQKQINKLKKENKIDVPLIDKMLTDFNGEMMCIAQDKTINSSVYDTVDDRTDKDTDEDDETIDENDSKTKKNKDKMSQQTDKDDNDDEDEETDTDTDDTDENEDEDDESDSKE